MGAVPKTRISSIMRGKRRQGQKAQSQLKKDPQRSQVSLHKRGLVAQMFNRMGLEFKHLLNR